MCRTARRLHRGLVVPVRSASQPRLIERRLDDACRRLELEQAAQWPSMSESYRIDLACCSYVRPQKCDIFEKMDESVTSAVQVPGIAREATGASRTCVGGTQHRILCAPEQ